MFLVGNQNVKFDIVDIFVHTDARNLLRIAFQAVENIRVLVVKMNRSRRVDNHRVSDRQNRIAG